MQSQFELIALNSQNFRNAIEEVANRRHFHDLRGFSLLVLDTVFNKSNSLAEINRNYVDLGIILQLVGYDSEFFKYFCENKEQFERFMNALLVQIKITRVPLSTVINSVLYFLIDSYVNALLPANDNVFEQLQRCKWFLSSKAKPATTSAFRLLRPQVIAAAYSPDSACAHLNSSESMYPRISQFVECLIEGLTDRSSPPSDCQILILRRIVLHYISFIVEPSSHRDFETFKTKLRRSDVLQKNLVSYFHKWLQGLSWDRLYWRLLDLWMSLILPADPHVNCDADKLRLFFDTVTIHFGSVFEVVQERCRHVDLSVANYVQFFERVISETFDPVMIKMYEKMGYDVESFLVELKIKVTTFRATSELFQLEKQQMHPETQFIKFINFVQNFLGMSPDQSGNNVDTLIEALDNRLPEELRQSQIVENTAEASLNASAFSNISSNSMTLFSPMANSTPRRRVPDFRVDPVTKLYYLSPQGRDQVLKRQASFDFSQCSALLSNQICIKFYEIEWLVKHLDRFSKKHNDSPFINNIRDNKKTNPFAFLASKVLLSQPLIPRYVPVYTKKVVAQPEFLDLRFMGNWFFIIFAGFSFLTFLNYLICIVF